MGNLFRDAKKSYEQQREQERKKLIKHLEKHKLFAKLEMGRMQGSRRWV